MFRAMDYPFALANYPLPGYSKAPLPSSTPTVPPRNTRSRAATSESESAAASNATIAALHILHGATGGYMSALFTLGLLCVDLILLVQHLRQCCIDTFISP